MVDTERAKELHRERQKRYYERHKASASASALPSASSALASGNRQEIVSKAPELPSALPSASSGFERKASAVSRQPSASAFPVKSIKPAEPKFYEAGVKNRPEPEPKPEPKEPSFFDFVFGKKEYADFKTKRKLALKQKRAESTSIISWINSLLGFGD